MKVYIHIGFPKTGTSAIQAHINCNWSWLARRGVYIPKTGYSPGLGHCYLFGKNDTENPPNEIAYLLRETSVLDDLADEIQKSEKSGFNAALLSWEGFCLLDETLIGRLKASLDRHDVTVYAYVREQAELTQSLMLQAIKARRTAETVFSFAEDESLTVPWYLNFFGVFSTWANAFKDSLAIRTKIYERKLLVGSDVVTDFINWLGLEVDEHFAYQGSDVNHSLDVRAAAVMALAKTAGLDAKGLTYLSRALSQSSILGASGHKHFLPERTMSRIRASHLESNRQFLREFPPENQVPEKLFEHFVREAPEPSKSEDPLVKLSRELCSIIEDRVPEIWHGNALIGFELFRVTSRAGNGWRQPAAKGIFSVSETSEIIFQLPAICPNEGPKGLKLNLNGVYFGKNSSTLVHRRETVSRENLQNATLYIPIDETVRTEGIHLKLMHDEPASPKELGTGNDSDKLAYQLQHIEYSFLWEEVPL